MSDQPTTSPKLNRRRRIRDREDGQPNDEQLQEAVRRGRKFSHAQVAKRKIALLTALEKTLGIRATACKKTGIEPATFSRWFKTDRHFRRKVREIDEQQKDFVEGKLLKGINEGKERSITFYLSTKGKGRGYTQRTEIMTPEGHPIKVQHEAAPSMEDKLKALTVDQLKALREIVMKVQGTDDDDSDDGAKK